MIVLYILSAILFFHTMAEDIPPLVSKTDWQTEMIILKGKPLNITCVSDGVPKPTIEWFKDGVKVDRSKGSTKAVPYGQLFLDPFTSTENGYYQCRATNPLGTSMSDMVHVMAEVPPQGEDSTDMYKVDEGQPFKLPCDLKPTLPPTEKRWYRGGDKHELYINNRRGMDTDGTLHFSYTISVEDSKLLLCGLVPESSQEKVSIVMFEVGTLQVKTTLSPSDNSRPKLAFTKDNVKAVIGHSVVLECFFSSKPTATVTWKNSSNHQVTKGNPRFEIFDYGRKLRIVKVEQQDQGYFLCTGTNKYGSDNGRIYVNVTSPPRVVAGGALVSQTIPDHRVYIMHCKTRAAYQESVGMPRWYRNGLDLTQSNVPDSTRYQFNSDYTQLQIKDLQKKDMACFQCNTSNSEGYEFFDSSLRVISSIEVIAKPEEDSVLAYGESVEITIRATGDSCCSINFLWHHNGTDIKPETWPPFHMDRDSDRLFFNTSLVPEDLLVSYLGVYRCRVSNVFENVDITFTIGLKGKAGTSTASASFSWWMIILICGIVAIIIAIVVIVAIYKSNFPRSTYMLEKKEIKHNLNPEEELLNSSFTAI